MAYKELVRQPKGLRPKIKVHSSFNDPELFRIWLIYLMYG